MPEKQEAPHVGVAVEDEEFIRAQQTRFGYGLGDIVTRTGPTFGKEGQEQFVPKGSLHTVVGWRRNDRMLLLEGFGTFGWLPGNFKLYARGGDNA